MARCGGGVRYVEPSAPAVRIFDRAPAPGSWRAAAAWTLAESTGAAKPAGLDFRP